MARPRGSWAVSRGGGGPWGNAGAAGLPGGGLPRARGPGCLACGRGACRARLAGTQRWPGRFAACVARAGACFRRQERWRLAALAVAVPLFAAGLALALLL